MKRSELNTIMRDAVAFINDKVKYVKPYAEKLLIVEEGQITPYHFHWSKTDVPLAIDGHRYSVPAGSVVRIKPGESISIQSGMYHKFWAEGGRALAPDAERHAAYMSVYRRYEKQYDSIRPLV